MNKNALLLALYEISMSIGNSLELNKMFQEAANMMLSRLNCSSVAICKNGGSAFELLYAKPKVLIKNESYVSVVKQLEQKFRGGDEHALVEKVGDKYYYLFELKNFGCFILTKSHDPLDDLIIHSLPKISLKFVNAIQACLSNKKIQESKARLSEAQSIAHLGSWTASYEARSSFWDDEIYRILGEEPQRFVPTYRHVLKYLTKAGQRKARRAITLLLNGKNHDYEGVFELLKKDGSRGFVQVKSRATFNSRGNPVHMVGSLLDITKQYQLERQIREESMLLKSIINTVPVRLFWKDTDLRYLGCNDLFAQDAGLQEQNDLIGKIDRDLPWKEEADNYRLDDKNVMETGMPKLNIEEQRTLKNRSRLWVSTSKVPLKGEDGKTVGILGAYLDITAKKEDEKKLKLHRDALQHQAHHDTLTTLPNRLLFLDRLNQAINKVSRNQSKVAVLFIDMDRFKEINDSLGHAFGDEAIKEVAKRLQRQIRKTDTLARFGGDEFIMILEDIDNPIVVVDVVQKLMKTMHDPIIIEGHRIYVTLSIGISVYPNDAETADSLLKNADAAMYKAKDEGRNTYRFYTEDMTEKAFERMVMAAHLRQAIEKKEFVLYFQQQVDGESNRIVGMEALIRWNHNSMGLVSPIKFIPIVEDTGLIIPLGKWILKTGMQQIVKWYAQGLNPGILAINLSMKQLQEHDFMVMLERMLDETKCKPQWIELEVTESQIMKDPEQTILMLRDISRLGIEIAIDDFGTGYSSLSYLKRLPIDKLKIDQSFVRELPDSQEDMAIVKAVIAFSKSLNLRIIAEGVETKEQKTALVENGCQIIQGYIYGKPVPADEMEKLLRDSHLVHSSLL